jgi:hypothetical protein
MGEGMRAFVNLFAAAAMVLPCVASSQSYQPPAHTAAVALLSAPAPRPGSARARCRHPDRQNRAPRELADTASSTGPRALRHRPGTVTPSSSRSRSTAIRPAAKRAAADVLQRRYAAANTIVLAGSDGAAPAAAGTPGSLAIALARIAE